MNQDELPSTRPYLIRAIHEWCCDNGFTPYLAVAVDASVQVPREFVKDGEIVLNTSYDATGNLRLGNDFIEFKARFGGVARDICVPVDHVVAIYARENGQGMAFPMPAAPGTAPSMGSDEGEATPGVASAGPRPAGPRLSAVPSQRTPVPEASPSDAAAGAPPTDDGPEPSGPDAAGGRPSLKRIK